MMLYNIIFTYISQPGIKATRQIIIRDDMPGKPEMGNRNSVLVANSKGG